MHKLVLCHFSVLRTARTSSGEWGLETVRSNDGSHAERDLYGPISILFFIFVIIYMSYLRPVFLSSSCRAKVQHSLLKKPFHFCDYLVPYLKISSSVFSFFYEAGDLFAYSSQNADEPWVYQWPSNVFQFVLYFFLKSLNLFSGLLLNRDEISIKLLYPEDRIPKRTQSNQSSSFIFNCFFHILFITYMYWEDIEVAWEVYSVYNVIP